MNLSRDRILTTHVGSLPRPDDLLEIAFAKDRHEDYDAAALEARVELAVAEVVNKQVRSGIDIVNDGEMSKINYATYVKERVTGFEGESEARVYGSDLAAFPQYLDRLFAAGGIGVMARPVCTAAIAYRGEAAVETDIANLNAAVQGRGAADCFINAASPGVIALFLGNDHYASHEAYVWALADAMKTEYDMIVGGGAVLQLDAPDLAMGRHIQFGDEDFATFRAAAEMNVEALNHATRDCPPGSMRLHLCWGNYDGPHHHDVPLADVIDLVFKARPQAVLFEGANPRHEHEWKVWRDAGIPDDKVLIPGVVNSTSNYIEHPELIADRLCRYTDIVGRERVIAGTDCGMSTSAGFPKVDPDIGWAKYSSMAKGARLASDRLWR
jgi:5-methyltetrahydropteroyltriglutamate--homocysteine methyltransferase